MMQHAASVACYGVMRCGVTKLDKQPHVCGVMPCVGVRWPVGPLLLCIGCRRSDVQ